MKFSVKIKQRSKVERFAAKCLSFEARFLGKLRTAMRASGKDLARAMRATMADGGWQPNDPDYMDWKRKHGFSTQPLFRTSLLANSISYKIVAATPDQMKGHVGWYKGMRYGGVLAEKIYKGRVPRRRKKDLGKPYSARKDTRDTQFLSDVAKFHEYGSERGTPQRAFIQKTTDDFGDLVFTKVLKATKASMPISGMEEAPF